MKFLVVDDESLIRRSLRRALEVKGHLVYEASDGRSGLKIWKDIQPDVVILDVLMPGLTGPQVLAEIDKPLKSKVVLISAYTGEYNLEKAQDLGADMFFPKPFNNIFEVVDLIIASCQKA